MAAAVRARFSPEQLMDEQRKILSVLDSVIAALFQANRQKYPEAFALGHTLAVVRGKLRAIPVLQPEVMGRTIVATYCIASASKCPEALTAAAHFAEPTESYFVFAAKNGYMDNLKSLLENSALDSEIRGKALVAAVHHHHQDCVEAIYDSGTISDQMMEKALVTAISVDNVPSFSWLLDRSRNDRFYLTYMHVTARKHDRPACIAVIRERGSFIDIDRYIDCMRYGVIALMVIGALGHVLFGS
jgi:hypothetical protein